MLQALQFAAEDLGPPLRDELNRTLSDISLGKELEIAFSELGARINDPELTVMLEVLLLLKQSGGNLPEILRRLREMMREREDLRRDIRVYTTQGRWSGYVVSLLPAAFLGLESLLSPAFIRRFLYIGGAGDTWHWPGAGDRRFPVHQADHQVGGMTGGVFPCLAVVRFLRFVHPFPQG